MSEYEGLPAILTIREVAKLLRVSMLTVKRWGKNRKIRFFRINSRGDRRFKKEDIINFIENNGKILS